MASVRLTNTLIDTIKRNITKNFALVREGYEITADTRDKVKDFAMSRLSKAVKEQEDTTKSIVGVVDQEVSARGGTLPRDSRVERGIASALTTHIGTWDSFYVKTIDPEPDSDTHGELITIYEVGCPYSDIINDNRKVLAWDNILQKNYTENKELVDEILPSFLKLRQLDTAEILALEYASSMIANCNTLTQLVRKWPNAVQYVPEDKLAIMNDKTKRTVAVQEDPVSIMNMDEALRSIHQQAEAVKALKQ